MVATATQAVASTLGPTARWTPLREHATQRELWECAKRFILIEAGRRSGKTEKAKRRGTRNSWARPLETGLLDYRIAYCAPVRDQARGIYWDDLKALQPREIVDRISETMLEIRLVNGATISVIGMDKPERIEGRPWDELYLDEFAEYKPGIWSRTILPALSTEGRLGKVWIYGVPRPSSDFRRLAEDARTDPEWAYFNWPSSTVVSQEVLENARRTMDPLTFAQEFEAKRVSFSGRAYYQFDRETHGKPGVRAQFYNPRAPLIVALDFNVDPGVAAIGQEVTHPTLGLIDAWFGQVWIERGSNTPMVCRKIVQDWGNHEGDVLLDGDATGGRRSTQNEYGGGDWAFVDEILGRHFTGRYCRMVGKSNPPQRDRLASMNSRLCSTAGDVRTLVDQDYCPKIIRDFEEVQLVKGGSGELDKDRKRFPDLTDISDAIGYSVYRRYPLNQDVSSWEPQ